jgi:predicted DNA-binding transcriptional regulator AlpA
MRDPEDEGFVSVEECAKRMGISVNDVWDLIDSRALRAYRYAGWGDTVVQPAILTGSFRPRKVELGKRPRKRAEQKTAPESNTGQ